MTTNHTPGPWTVSEGATGERTVIWAKGAYLARIDGNCGQSQADREANAAHIVRCVNAHDELVAALEAITAAVDSWQDDDQPMDASDFIALIETTAENARNVLAGQS